MSTALWLHLLGLLALETLVVAGLAAGASAACRRPWTRRAVWQAALLGVAALWLAELGGLRAGPGASAFPRPVREGEVRLGDAVPARVSPGVPTPMASPAGPDRAAPGTWRWPAWLWLAGSLALVVRASALRVILAVEVRRRGRPLPAAGVSLGGWEELCGRLGVRRVRVLQLPDLRGPVAFGVFHPTVALPADFALRFSPVQREAMLAHELAHLAGRDPLWRWMADLVVAMAWWHPGVWWVRSRLRAASEAAADAASVLVPHGPVALAESLVGMGRELAMPGGLGMAGSGRVSDLTRRVRSLLSPDVAWVRPGRSSWLWPRLGGIVVTTSLLLVPTGPGQSPWRALAAAADSSAGEDRPVRTASDLLGDPRFREVVEALRTSPSDPTRRPAGTGRPEAGSPPLPQGGEAVPVPPSVEAIDTPGAGGLWTAARSVYVPLREPTPADLVADPGGRVPAPPAAAAPEAVSTQVELRVTLVELFGGSREDLGLDWLFGGAASDDPAPEVGTPPGSGPLGDSPMAGSVTVERRATRGEWVALAAGQYGALREQFERRGNVDVLSAPRVSTLAGRSAQVSVTQMRTVVTGPKVQPAGAGNEAHLLYETAQVPVGPVVDLTAHLRDGGWEIAIGAAVTELLGYEEPPKSQRVRGPDGTAGVPALPRMRVRVAEAVGRCGPGEVIALRGPLLRETIQ